MKGPVFDSPVVQTHFRDSIIRRCASSCGSFEKWQASFADWPRSAFEPDRPWSAFALVFCERSVDDLQDANDASTVRRVCKFIRAVARVVSRELSAGFVDVARWYRYDTK